MDHPRPGAGHGGLTDCGRAKPAEAGAPEGRLQPASAKGRGLVLNSYYLLLRVFSGWQAGASLYSGQRTTEKHMADELHMHAVPEGHPRIARRFNAGICPETNPVPKGRLKRFLTERTNRGTRGTSKPGVETPGYFQMSLRDRRSIEPLPETPIPDLCRDLCRQHCRKMANSTKVATKSSVRRAFETGSSTARCVQELICAPSPLALPPSPLALQLPPP
jgi:hypothetical protein